MATYRQMNDLVTCGLTAKRLGSAVVNRVCDYFYNIVWPFSSLAITKVVFITLIHGGMAGLKTKMVARPIPANDYPSEH